jgi:hypothetical protein
VRFIQACPPALSEFQSHQSGKLSAAGLSLSRPHPNCKWSLSFLCCFVLQPHIMGGYGRQIHASRGICICKWGRSCVTPLGPWTRQNGRKSYIAPIGSNTFDSQTFRGLEVTGRRGTAFVYIGYRWCGAKEGHGVCKPPFPNASQVWLPLRFDTNNSVQEMKWEDSWQVDLSGDFPPLKAGGLKTDDFAKSKRHFPDTSGGSVLVDDVVVPPASASSSHTGASGGGRVSGWTHFQSCGATMCQNMSKQLEQIVKNANVLHTIFPFVSGAAPQYNSNHSICSNGTATITSEAAFPWPAFRFGAGRGGAGPVEGDGSGRYFCSPSPDSLVTAWAAPVKAAGVEIMPILDCTPYGGGAKVWPVAGRDEGWFDVAVSTALKFGFSGWSLDVEPTISPPGSGEKQMALYVAFLRTFTARLAKHNLRLSTAEPNGNWLNLKNHSDPYVPNMASYYPLGHSGAEITTMSTYYGVMPLTAPGYLTREIAQWQL